MRRTATEKPQHFSKRSTVYIELEIIYALGCIIGELKLYKNLVNYQNELEKVRFNFDMNGERLKDILSSKWENPSSKYSNRR